MLNDRGLMGEGCIDKSPHPLVVERAGFSGMIEVEIFSERCGKRSDPVHQRDSRGVLEHL